MRLLMATIVLFFDLELDSSCEDWADQKIYTLWEKRPLICRLIPTAKT
jgi:hypothetical protein